MSVVDLKKYLLNTATLRAFLPPWVIFAQFWGIFLNYFLTTIESIIVIYHIEEN